MSCIAIWVIALMLGDARGQRSNALWPISPVRGNDVRDVIPARSALPTAKDLPLLIRCLKKCESLGSRDGIETWVQESALKCACVKSNSQRELKNRVRGLLPYLLIHTQRVMPRRNQDDAVKPITPDVLEGILGNLNQCKPRPTLVRVPAPSNAGEFHHPGCVEVPRCGQGCCGAGLRCQPDPEYIDYHKYKVLVMKRDSEIFKMIGYREVPLLRHNRCSCQCIKKPTECDPKLHTFSKEDCSCHCNSRVTCPNHEIWNEETCSCVCRSPVDCLTDDDRTRHRCRCKRPPEEE